MHMTTLRTVTVGVVVALVAAACDNDGITRLNTDPNNPPIAPSAPVFTSAARQSVDRWLGSAYDLRATEWVAQHLAEDQYPQEDQYSRLQGVDTRNLFGRPYYSELQDLQKVIAVGMADEKPGVYGPAMLLQAWDFAYLTNTWGDVPFSEAFQGDSPDGTLTPKYDAQKEIYDSLFARIDKAVTDLAAGAANELGSADPIYGGDPAKWAKFGNSLRARLAMQIVNVDPAKADAELSAAFSGPGGVTETNADAAALKWPGDGVYNNSWADNFDSRDDHRMSNTLMDIMLATDDPRIPVYAQPVADSSLYPGGYGGMPNGLSNEVAATYANTASAPGIIFYADGGGYSRPSYLITAAEVLFLKAEAAERGLGGLTPSQAQGFYEAAITASMEQWGIDDAAAVSAYLAEPDVAFKDAAGAGNVAEALEQIAVQKWIALYGDGGQAWAEWRRTCQPSTVKAGPAAIIDFVPRRFEYSTDEYSVNGASVQAAIAQQGPDTFGTRMYWDTNPTAAPTYVDAATCGPQ